jgi:hypothetical protein
MDLNPNIFVAYVEKTVTTAIEKAKHGPTVRELKSFKEEEFLLKYLRSTNKENRIIRLFSVNAVGQVTYLKAHFDGHLQLIAAEPPIELDPVIFR